MRACRKCRTINHDKTNPRCVACLSNDLTDEYEGIVIIIDPVNSEVAKRLKIDREGEFALKIR